jgi:hypothetical protein
MKEKPYRPPRHKTGRWYGNETYTIYITKQRGEDRFDNMLYDFVVFTADYVKVALKTAADWQLKEKSPDPTMFHEIFPGIFGERRGKGKAKLL